MCHDRAEQIATIGRSFHRERARGAALIAAHVGRWVLLERREPPHVHQIERGLPFSAIEKHLGGRHRLIGSRTKLSALLSLDARLEVLGDLPEPTPQRLVSPLVKRDIVARHIVEQRL